MKDFLGNLILRSTEDPSPLSILQPRLPSLFEPMGGETELPVTSPDADVREPIERSSGLLNDAPSIKESLTHRSKHSAEPEEKERTTQPARTRVLPDPARTVHPRWTETQQEIVQPERPVPHDPLKIQAAQVIRLREDPRRTIMPPTEVRIVREELRAIDDRGSAPRELERLSPAKPGSGSAQKADITKTGSTPTTVWQPFEQKQAQAPQQVVEIHIGRIEVRATPQSTPRRVSQKATTMSLEEYLRSRPGEKR